MKKLIRMLEFIANKMGYRLITFKQFDELEVMKSRYKRMIEDYLFELDFYKTIARKGSTIAHVFYVEEDGVNSFVKAGILGGNRYPNYQLPIKVFTPCVYGDSKNARTSAQMLCDKLNEKLK